MARAYAQREKERRQLDIDIITGGTDPADSVHDVVMDILSEDGLDRSGMEPRAITDDEILKSDYVITMGCSAEEACATNPTGETRDWDLEDPDGKSLETVREIRDEIKRRITILFDELE